MSEVRNNIFQPRLQGSPEKISRVEDWYRWKENWKFLIGWNLAIGQHLVCKKSHRIESKIRTVTKHESKMRARISAEISSSLKKSSRTKRSLIDKNRKLFNYTDSRLQQEEHSFEHLFNKTENAKYFLVASKTDYLFNYSFLRSRIRVTRNVYISRACIYTREICFSVSFPL